MTSGATLVWGLGVAGRAVAAVLHQRGESVLVGDDDLTSDHRRFAQDLGLALVEPTSDAALDDVVASVGRLAPAPGVPEGHRVIEAARRAGKPIVSELELAYDFENESGRHRPMLGITGTDGKTTTTLMTKAILASAGRNPEAVGNTETPLIAALDSSADCFAVECSSFRLAFTERFRCKAAAWLNIAPDHLDWHANYDSYFAAKAKMWAHVAAGDIAVAPVDDAAILEVAQRSNARVVTFGAARGDYHAINGVLTSPHGVIMEERAMRRALPHDVTNALAAAALCIESGLASPAHVSEALASFEHAAHRIEFVRDLDGVRWYNDSKATSPHAAAVAIQSFDSIVLIAGGKNKDLDLNEMAAHRDHVRAVVATGASADAIEAAFSGHCVVRKASTMQEAIDHARELARSGDVVLLSPGCTSYDWYSNYAERGDDFRSRVLALK